MIAIGGEERTGKVRELSDEVCRREADVFRDYQPPGGGLDFEAWAETQDLAPRDRAAIFDEYLRLCVREAG
jgi:hypothetical protein